MRLRALGLVTAVLALGCGGGNGASMEGVWCQTDSPYCYEFVGDTVIEDLGPNKRVEGTWEIQEGLLLLHYTNPAQTITWEIDKHTPDVLLLIDYQSKERFIMNHYDTMPPVSGRPR